MDYNFEETETNIKMLVNETVEAVPENLKSSKPKTPKKKTAICTVVGVLSEKRVVISFNDFGLIINTDRKTKFSKVEIEYSGTIGKEDFEFRVTKCIQ